MEINSLVEMIILEEAGQILGRRILHRIETITPAQELGAIVQELGLPEELRERPDLVEDPLMQSIRASFRKTFER